MTRRTEARLLSLLLIVLVVVACAARPPVDVAGVDESITVRDARSDPDGTRNRRVLWGGVIVHVANLKDETQIEVLAYPLDRSGRPDTSSGPSGRFLAIRSGYLETGVYAQGRLLTLVGPLAGTRQGKIGEAPYTYPVVMADQLHLWPREAGYAEPRFHFGIGVIF
jgi:outer membrane lipoprotein